MEKPLPLQIAQQFSKSIVSIEPLGNGFINDTYLVTTDTEPFVLQRINKHVFPQPEQIMLNLTVLNQHLNQIDENQVTLKIPSLLTTENGHDFFCDGQGEYWRSLSYIANTESLETISNLAQAEQVGYALGQFHRLTHRLDSEKLHDTLPGFHIAPRYLNHYLTVSGQSKIKKDPYCADFIDRYQHIAHDLETAKEAGLLSVSVIHGDPKLNNFLFDKTSQRIVSIIDLDTVKPGLIHYDIGDCLRSCCHDLATDKFNLEICQALLTSYLKVLGDLLTANDSLFLYPAIRLIPFELGLRFYTDYLEGNRYFKVAVAGQNLMRASAQFRLCANLMAQEKAIKELIECQAVSM
jgi:Ser/Thr protein kinase RdoA (MazF antagonist)